MIDAAFIVDAVERHDLRTHPLRRSDIETEDVEELLRSDVGLLRDVVEVFGELRVPLFIHVGENVFQTQTLGIVDFRADDLDPFDVIPDIQAVPDLEGMIIVLLDVDV